MFLELNARAGMLQHVCHSPLREFSEVLAKQTLGMSEARGLRVRLRPAIPSGVADYPCEITNLRAPDVERTLRRAEWRYEE